MDPSSDLPRTEQQEQCRDVNAKHDPVVPAPVVAAAAAAEEDLDTEWGRAVRRPPPIATSNEDTHSMDDPRSTAVDSELDVAIVGGGLVGLAIAIGLSRNNISCKVYERAPQLRSVSQGILCIQPNGMTALEEIHPDIPRLIAKHGCERRTRVITRIDAEGKETEVVTDTGTADLETFGRLRYGITWHNMQRLLASLLPEDVVVTGHSLASFDEEPNHVLLHFANGTTVRAGAVFACDGVFSVARRQMFPNDSPIYFGQLNWASLVDTDRLPANVHPERAVHFFSHDGTPRWMSMLNDAGQGTTFWQLRVVDPVKAMSVSGSAGRGGLGLPGVKETLLPVVKPCPLLWQAISEIPESQIFERSIVGRYSLSTWRSSSDGGRLVLVGDSAHGMHPNIGQGANSGFESAATAVRAMVDVAERRQHQQDHGNKCGISSSNELADWSCALQQFEKLRKPRADIIQQFANLMGVHQATGRETLSSSTIQQMMEWICENDPEKEPPGEVLDVLECFDPCDYPGVSLLW